ncbi:MAG: 5'-nucleotidase C-terminal domain-containing protein [Candidatus Delongbacteria bacterium]|jgi:2',3'-cyclic-nucleotide 2'-phosphodiesterase (5'-nucleotidase family)|nr:5'-nucleotidase C-terminal domain-containing protein [Candidatus Delongbacteria bacterium]
MKKYIFLLFVLFVFLSCSKIDSSTYTILSVNSMNGQIFPKEKNGLKTGGFSLLSSKVKEIRNDKRNGKVLLFGNSNFIYGKVEAYFTSGKAVISLMNELNFNGLVIGHREFYFGLDVLESLSKKANFPLLSANIVKKDSSRFDFIKPYVILPDKKIAIIGISSSKIMRANLEKDVNKLLLLDPIDTVTKYVRILKKKGIERIIAIGDFKCIVGPVSSDYHYQFYEMIKDSEIDTFIGTSSKEARNDPDCICNTSKTVKLISSDINGEELLLYRFQNGSDQDFSEIYWINSDSIDPDNEISKTLHNLNELVNETAGEILGYSENNIKHLEGGIFSKESYLGDFISDVIRDYTKTDVMLLNSGKIRNGFKKGPITLMDLYNVLPYEGTIVKVSLTGKQLLRILESSCSLKMSKSFLQVSGIRFKFDLSKEVSKRVIQDSVTINGEKLNLDKKYSVALTKYIFDGGDQYIEFTDMNVELEMVFQKQMREILKQHIKLIKIVKTHRNGRIVEVNETL